MTDMLLGARYVHEEEMETYEVKDSEDNIYDYVLATNGTSTNGEALFFEANQYEGRLKNIGIYLSTLRKQEGWIDRTFKDIKH